MTRRRAETGLARCPRGLGPEMRPRGLKFSPPTPRRWPAARATGLVVAPARRASHARHPGGVGAPPGWVLRPAREELADGSRFQALAAKRGPMPVFVSREAKAIATSGAPRGERVERRAAAQAASGCAFRRSASLARGEGNQDDGVPGAANNTGGGALASRCMFSADCRGSSRGGGLLAPPLRGRGGGVVMRDDVSSVELATPTPKPSPQGEGRPTAVHENSRGRTTDRRG